MVSYQQKLMLFAESDTKSIKLGNNHTCLVIHLFGFKDYNIDQIFNITVKVGCTCTFLSY